MHAPADVAERLRRARSRPLGLAHVEVQHVVAERARAFLDPPRQHAAPGRGRAHRARRSECISWRRRPAPRCCAAGGPAGRSRRSCRRAGRRTARAPAPAARRGNSAPAPARPGGLTQPKPPPSMIAASAASHSACRSSSSSSVDALDRAMLGVGSRDVRRGIAQGVQRRKLVEDAQADLLALLDVELGAGAVAGGDHGDDRAAVIGGGEHLVRIAAAQRVAVHEIGVIAGLEARPAADARRARSRSAFQPICGRRRLGRRPSRRSRRRSSRSPAVIACSSPRSAISCMPTQMPRNGVPASVAASIASRRPGTAARPRAQSAKAPWPGSTMRSAAATVVGVGGDDDVGVEARRARPRARARARRRRGCRCRNRRRRPSSAPQLPRRRSGRRVEQPRRAPRPRRGRRPRGPAA